MKLICPVEWRGLKFKQRGIHVYFEQLHAPNHLNKNEILREISKIRVKKKRRFHFITAWGSWDSFCNNRAHCRSLVCIRWHLYLTLFVVLQSAIKMHLKLFVFIYISDVLRTVSKMWIPFQRISRSFISYFIFTIQTVSYYQPDDLASVDKSSSLLIFVSIKLIRN